MGADFTQPAVLTFQTADPAWREFDTVLPVTIPDTPIRTTQEDGRGTALPGQNTVADPNCGDYVLSTVGFDVQGRFHALVLFGVVFGSWLASQFLIQTPSIVTDTFANRLQNHSGNQKVSNFYLLSPWTDVGR